jgi:hypothetical protein
MQDDYDKNFNLSRCISTKRFGSYIKDGFTVFEVYDWNIELSEALYPLLHVIEIGLRNRLHDEISVILGDEEWLLNRNRILLERLDIQWLEKIDHTIIFLRKQNKLDEGNLLSEVSFSFWTTLLSGPFERNGLLWPNLKNKVFPTAKGITISNIRQRFDQIRKFRNRVFHYEPIWNKKDLAIFHDLIVEAIKWIEPELLRFVQNDRFKSIYQKGPDIKR